MEWPKQTWTMKSNTNDAWVWTGEGESGKMSKHYSSVLFIQSLGQVLRNKSYTNDVLKLKLPVMIYQSLKNQASRPPENGFRDRSNFFNSCALSWQASIKSAIVDILRPGKNALSHLMIGRDETCRTLYPRVLGFVDSNFHFFGSPRRFGILKANQTAQPQNMFKILSNLPLFNKEPSWRLQQSINKSFLLLPALLQADLGIFPKSVNPNFQQFSFLAFSWTGCNTMSAPISNDVLWEMMIITSFIWQLDEFMERNIADFSDDELACVEASILRLAEQSWRCTRVKELGERVVGLSIHHELSQHDSRLDVSKSFESRIADIESTLKRFFDYFTDHPKVVASTLSLRNRLRREICAVLLAHVTQMKDSHKYACYRRTGGGLRNEPSDISHRESSDAVSNYKPMVKCDPPNPFFSWVHGSGAINTNVPFAFAFYSCLITPSPGVECFKTGKQKYLIESVIQKAAVMMRMLNDLGSLKRDRAEGNLNSLDFSEFKCAEEYNVTNEMDVEAAKDMDTKEQLLSLVEYERRGLETAFAELEKAVADQELMGKIRLFINVVDFYGQIYVAQDLGKGLK